MATVNVGKNVPDSAFQSQKTITSVNFGSNCTVVGKNAFEGCISLSAINDNNKIKTIGAGAFAGTAINEAKFSYLNTFTKILGSNYYGAFQSCSQLTYVNIPNCNTIPQGTFYDCSNLISIDAQNCKQIYANAFKNCYNLTNINLQKCNYIAGNAFLNCSGLKSFNFENCTIIGNYAFSGCSMLEEADLTKCVGKIEERPLGDFVTLGIGSSAFQNCTNLKKIYLSNSNGIGESAFTGCINLTKVYIKADKSKPNYIIPLGFGAFKTSKWEIINKNIRFYLGADIIGDYINASDWVMYKNYMTQFADQNQILYTTNNNEIIDIYSDSESDSDIMEKYNFDNEYYNETFGLITFYNSDKSGIPNITKLDEPDQKFFKGSTKLTSIDLPLHYEIISESEFEGCTNLITYTPPSSNSLKEIKNYAFKNCTSLTSFEIPDSIKTLGEGIFAGCSNIKNFKGNFVTYGGKAIVKDGTLISVVTKDDNETNGRIYNISEIDPSIKRLGEYCFSGCKELRRVDIPDTVTEIGKCAFEGCENLCEIHFYGNETIEKDLFYDNSDSDSDSDNNSNFNSNLKIFILQENFQTFIENNPVFAYEYKDYIYPKPSDNTIIYYTNNNDNIINDSDTKVDTEVSFTTYDDDINSLKYTYFITDIKKFTNNKDIQKVIIGENNKKINESAFKNCTSLEYVYIPNTITEFGNECFYGCEKLTSIIIPNKPNKFIYIEQYIEQPEYTRSIDTNNNIIIKEFLSKGNTKFGNDIFYGCKNLKKFDSYYKDFLSSDNMCYIDGNSLMFFAEGGIIPTKTEGEEFIKKYEFPSDIKDKKVNTINKSAFKGTDIDAIKICDSISTIGESAFEGCTIKSIDGLDNVTNIQKNAFKNCKSLGEISLSNVSTIGESAFERCTNMIVTNNDLSKVTEIGAGAFKFCEKFGYVEVDDKNNVVDVNKIVNLKKITSINDYTFWGCYNLNHICLSENITEIGNYAFYECSALYGVYIVDDSVSNSNSSKLKSIGNYAFYMNSNLSKFYLNRLSNLTHIGNNTFEKCTNYKYNLILPNSVESIGTNCFASSGIEKLTLNKESNLKKISQNAFTNCSNLASVDIKSTTTTIIGKESFLDCKILKTLNLSDTVEYINTSAFAGCKTIKSVYLPLNLIELGHLCFDTGGTINIFIKKQNDLNDDLSNLKICKFTNFTTRPFGETSFGASISTTTVSIHVPQHIISNINGIKDKYISNIYWSTYASSIYVYVKTQISDRNPILRPT